MPGPLVILALPELIGWIVGIFGAAYGLFRYVDGKSLDELKAEIEAQILNWICAYAADKAGLQLDPANPLSDASFANAITQRTGVPIRSLKDRNGLIEDLELYAAGRISEKSGYQITQLRDPVKLKRELIDIGAAIVTERTQIPIAPLPDDLGEIQSVVRDRVLTWAEAHVTERMAGQVENIVQRMGALENIEGLAGRINERLAEMGSLQEITPRGLALQIAEELATGAVARFQAEAVGINKMTRRKLQIRAAQERFRAKHGNRQKYVPLGMAITIGDEPPAPGP
jgi:hypothetical protein